jgi:hypothetical protein
MTNVSVKVRGTSLEVPAPVEDCRDEPGHVNNLCTNRWPSSHFVHSFL